MSTHFEKTYDVDVLLKQSVSIKIMDPLLFMDYVTTAFPGFYTRKLKRELKKYIEFEVSYKNNPVCYVVFDNTGTPPSILEKNLRKVCRQAAKETYPAIEESVIRTLKNFSEFREMAGKPPVKGEPDDLSVSLAYLNILYTTILGTATAYYAGIDPLIGGVAGFFGSLVSVFAVGYFKEISDPVSQIVGIVQNIRRF